MRRNYKKRQNLIVAIWVFLCISGTILMYVSTKNVLPTAISGMLFGSTGILLWAQYHNCDRYFSGIVEELSDLCGNLVTLEEKELFPDSEDTQLSKLQNRIMKLVRILRKQKQDSMKEQENMKALVSDISHQLKTPLANLKMYADFLEEEDITKARYHTYLNAMKQSIERLNFLSENMIKISRLESGLVQINRKPQSINETILMAIKDIFPKAMNNETEITYDATEEIIVSHDRRWSAEAVFNLLDNAVKYSPKGSVIAVTARKLGMFCVIDVTDQAPVIAEEERTKIFQRFYRGKGSSKMEGIGIGLYLAREITTKQGGYMNLTAQEMGNTFSVYLPVETTD